MLTPPIARPQERATEYSKTIAPSSVDAVRLTFTFEPMNITWVTSLPTGKESGTYLALDLGGTNLRVCLVTLNGQGDAEVTQEKYHLPSEIKTGTSEQLWDFVADSLQKFVEQHQPESQNRSEPLPLGFTFSYPATQDRIDHGRLQTWTKGWDIDGVEGQNVAAMLEDAIARRVRTPQLLRTCQC